MASLRFRKAFTLAESLAASVILAVAVVGVSGALLSAQQQTRAGRESHVLTMLTRQLLERVTAMPLVLSNGTTGAPGWPTVTDASQYDTIDDFAGYQDQVDASAAFEQSATDTSALVSSGAEPVSVDSTTLTAAAGHACTRTVTVSYPTTLYGASITPGQVAIVTVTVRRSGGASVTLSQMVCKWTSARSG
jgi:type II secretory pathway pseudopilin PulG